MKNSINANGEAFRLTEEESIKWGKDVVAYILASEKDGYASDSISINENVTVWTLCPHGDYDAFCIGEAEFELCQADAELAALAIVRELTLAGIKYTLRSNDTGYCIPDINL